MICREGWFQKICLGLQRTPTVSAIGMIFLSNATLAFDLPTLLWLRAVSVYKSAKVSFPLEECVKEVQEWSWNHKRKALQYVMGLLKLQGTALIRALPPSLPKRLQQIGDKGEPALHFSYCLPFISASVRVLQMPHGRLRRPLVKMQNSSYPGGILWWKDWNQAMKKLILKIFQQKVRKNPWFFLSVIGSSII